MSVIANFEKLFGVPADHQLELVRSKSCGDAVRWEHTEYDASGVMVARYETLEDVDPVTGRYSRNWRKLCP